MSSIVFLEQKTANGNLEGPRQGAGFMENMIWIVSILSLGLTFTNFLLPLKVNTYKAIATFFFNIVGFDLKLKLSS